jgi:hypothetical protein
MKFLALVCVVVVCVMAQEPVAPADTSVHLISRPHARVIVDDQAEILSAFKSGLIAGSVGTVKVSESVMVLQTIDELQD